MAIAEPALRAYGLQRLRFRGGGLIGAVIGTGIGIGEYIRRNYDFGKPGPFQPDRTYRGVPYVNGNASPYAGTNKQYQALYKSKQYRYGKRYKRRYNSRSKCSCTRSC